MDYRGGYSIACTLSFKKRRDKGYREKEKKRWLVFAMIVPPICLEKSTQIKMSLLELSESMKDTSACAKDVGG